MNFKFYYSVVALMLSQQAFAFDANGVLHMTMKKDLDRGEQVLGCHVGNDRDSNWCGVSSLLLGGTVGGIQAGVAGALVGSTAGATVVSFIVAGIGLSANLTSGEQEEMKQFAVKVKLSADDAKEYLLQGSAPSELLKETVEFMLQAPEFEAVRNYSEAELVQGIYIAAQMI